MTRPMRRLTVLACAVSVLTAAALAAAALAPELETKLRDSTYVYISSERKDGSFGAPAEIWFMYHESALWVGTRVTSWRVKRIRAGRTKATVAIGSPEGPSFAATGTLVKDPAMNAVLFRHLAEKYPDGWPKHEERFRSSLADGSMTLVKYVPAG